MKNKTKLPLKNSAWLVFFFLGICPQGYGEESGLDDNLVFDEKMFRGSNVSQGVLQHLTTDDSVLPGEYNNTPILINGYRVGEENVVVSDRNNKAIICMSPSILDKAGFKEEYIAKLDKLKQKKPV